MIITWDEPKRQKTIEARGLDFADVEMEFFLDAVVLPARGDRYKAIGVIDNLVCVVVFVRLGTEGLGIISLRRANRKERLTYEQAHAPTD